MPAGFGKPMGLTKESLSALGLDANAFAVIATNAIRANDLTLLPVRYRKP